MPKVGVCLSGCGFRDGAEIHESVLTLLALDQAGAEVVCMAPDMDQALVVDHLTGKTTHEKRNVLVESARIARGQIRDIADVKATDFDALIFPGGFGAALNLCDFASRGADAEVHPQVARLVGETMEAGKPIGAICIAPAMMAAAARDRGLELTIGTDVGTSEALAAMGAKPASHAVDEIHVDERNRVVTTPAYMLGPGPAAINKGIHKLVDKVLQMTAAAVR